MELRTQSCQQRLWTESVQSEQGTACSVSKNPKLTPDVELLQEEAEELVWEQRHYLKDKNIVGLSVGPKMVKGEMTDCVALIFDVVEKKQKPEKSEEIPGKVPLKKKESEWIVTDVVETGRLIFNRAEGGSAICVENGPNNLLLGPCTLGAIVPRIIGHDAKKETVPGKKEMQLITCAHLIHYEEQYIGRNILYLDLDQYKVVKKLTNRRKHKEFRDANQVLFPVTNIYPVRKYRGSPDEVEFEDREFNEIDFLWADVLEPEKVSETINGQIHGGIREPRQGEKFTLTGIKCGEHKNREVIYPVTLSRTEWVKERDSEGEFITYWKNLIRYNIPTRPGDSGAALVSETDGKIIGLHMIGSGNGKFGYACQFKKLMELA